MTDNNTHLLEHAGKSPGLKKVIQNLNSLNEGRLFIPVHVLETDHNGECNWLCEVFKDYADREECAFLRLAPQNSVFPPPDLEEEFLEKFLSLCPEKNGAVNTIAKKIRSPRTGTAFETDQTVLLNSREKLQHFECWLQLLTHVPFDRPFVVFIENALRSGRMFTELLFYLARNIYLKQQALRKEDIWPYACFIIVTDGRDNGDSPASLFKKAPFISLEKLSFVPPVIQNVLDEKKTRLSLELASLRPIERDVLSWLSLTKKPLPIDHLRSISGLSYDSFNRIIKKTVQKRLVSVYGAKGRRNVEISSGLVQTLMLQSLGEKEKQSIHEKLAQKLPSEDRHALARSYHFFSIGQNGRGLSAAYQALAFFKNKGLREQAKVLLDHLIVQYLDQIPEEKRSMLRHDLADLYTMEGMYEQASTLLHQNIMDQEKRGEILNAAETRVAMGIVLGNMGKKEEALTALSEAFNVLSKHKKHINDILRIQLARARIKMEKGDFKDALRMGEDALALLQKHFTNTRKWRHLKAITYNRLGSIYSSLSDFENAEEAYEISYKMFQGLPDSLEKGGLCCNLGNFYTNCGKYTLAGKYYKRSAAIAHTIGAKELLSLVEANLCVLAVNQWRLDQAEEHIQAALACAEEVGSSRYVKFARLCLATLRCRQGRYHESISIFTAECDKARAESDRYLLMNNLLQLVYPCIDTGQWKKAGTAVSEALTIAEELSWPRGLLESELISGQISAHLCLWNKADRHSQKACEVPWAHHGHIDAELAQLEGWVAFGRMEWKKAIRCFKKALAAFKKLSITVHAMRCRLDLASVFLAVGNTEKAISEIDTIRKSLSEIPADKRPPVVWIRTVVLKTETALAGSNEKKKSWEEGFYELVEVLARGRELGLFPFIWYVLTLLAAVSEKLKDIKSVKQHLKEAETAFNDYLRSIPEEARPVLLKSSRAEKFKQLTEKYLKKQARRKRETKHSETVLQEKAFKEIIGTSPLMRELFVLIQRVAPSDLPVLITGESGTGKELIAQAVHQLSARSDKPFIDENCAALPEQLAESELFGYKKGAFAGAHKDRKGRIEAVSSGTLFLDKIESLPLHVQAKFLRVMADGTFRPLGGLETQKSDFRLITTTACNLRKEVERGTFRSDLFYRILGVEIRLPPLRERPEDILELTSHFLRKHSSGKPSQISFTTAAKQALLHYHWPGNIRELENEIHRLVLLGLAIVDVNDLRIGSSCSHYKILHKGFVQKYAFPEAQSLFEKEYLQQALEECGGVISRAAQLLGMNRRSVYKMMGRLGIEPGPQQR